MDQPLAAREGATLVRQHTASYAEQPRGGITAVIGEPRRRAKRGQERLADHIRDVTGAGASRDRVTKHPVLVTAIETPERPGISSDRGRQQVRAGLIHTRYLPALSPAFQPASLATGPRDQLAKPAASPASTCMAAGLPSPARSSTRQPGAQVSPARSPPHPHHRQSIGDAPAAGPNLRSPTARISARSRRKATRESAAT